MPRERDEKSGKYTERYLPDTFVTALEELSGAATTQEVADEVGCAYRTAFAKLSELEDAGGITSRTVGNAYLWHPVSAE
ncbi:hypothetical protein [Natrinema altunense]|uniref:ArsR family transcriptional regulator n=1 Tax=Natrinema altunense (strain JCM 12890 / CGMCC 1.3731 / AJ2) TaxID=1227494 RepID=L9ZAZ1_NATA2|nr:hypothetical protein [Natrinema altunense]ELY83544.1 hypothetical protein C485_17367 [Natrinema altunense JCM 12890]